MPALERGCRWGWGCASRSTEPCSVWAWRLSLFWRMSPPSPSSVAPLSSSPSFLSQLGKMALLVHQVHNLPLASCYNPAQNFPWLTITQSETSHTGVGSDLSARAITAHPAYRASDWTTEGAQRLATPRRIVLFAFTL